MRKVLVSARPNQYGNQCRCFLSTDNTQGISAAGGMLLNERFKLSSYCYLHLLSRNISFGVLVSLVFFVCVFVIFFFSEPKVGSKHLLC